MTYGCPRKLEVELDKRQIFKILPLEGSPWGSTVEGINRDHSRRMFVTGLCVERYIDILMNHVNVGSGD